ncbi:hypothetical protein [Nocardia sp. CA-119907]|uniref:hypothetical protein n=1 Tax=Nocardia sp. CA-119907 TaxID=3239973 RepID=UPI003D9583D9
MVGTFVGDYYSQESGGPYFLFRDGRIGETRQPMFGVPTDQFTAEALDAYGPLVRSAQTIHEG